MPKVLITETVLRDAQQSLLQGRLKLQHVLPIAKTLDDIGFHALDAWGGWTFAASIRALKEDPWQRLRALRGAIEKTPLQMLIRGQTLIGQAHQPDDVVRAFIDQAVSEIVSAQPDFWCSLIPIYHEGNWPMGLLSSGELVVL